MLYSVTTETEGKISEQAHIEIIEEKLGDISGSSKFLSVCCVI